MTTQTNFDYIQTSKNDNGQYECERCQTEFSDPSEVCWAECGDYSKKHGVPLCAECCEDQKENWAEDDEEEACDDRDAPNTYPYKKCSVCGDRKSCGNYNDENEWFCEDCFEEDSDPYDPMCQVGNKCQGYDCENKLTTEHECLALMCLSCIEQWRIHDEEEMKRIRGKQ